MTEQWVPAFGFEGFYEVSDAGRVRGVDRLDSWGRRRPGVILRNARKGKNRPGGGTYLRIRLSMRGKVHDVTLHTLVLLSFVGPRPPKHDGCHNDGDVFNNALSNLRWDTSSANQRDKILHGTIAWGSRNGFAKLTVDDALAIKESTLGSTDLARRFGVSRIHVQRIRRGDAWAGALAVAVIARD